MKIESRDCTNTQMNTVYIYSSGGPDYSTLSTGCNICDMGKTGPHIDIIEMFVRNNKYNVVYGSHVGNVSEPRDYACMYCCKSNATYILHINSKTGMRVSTTHYNVCNSQCMRGFLITLVSLGFDTNGFIGTG